MWMKYITILEYDVKRFNQEGGQVSSMKALRDYITTNMKYKITGNKDQVLKEYLWSRNSLVCGGVIQVGNKFVNNKYIYSGDGVI